MTDLGDVRTLGELLERIARRAPDSPGLTVPGSPSTTWTFAELLRDAKAVAGTLLSQYRPGDRIALVLPNGAEPVLLQLGTALAGMTLVPMNIRSTGNEIAHMLGVSGAVAVYVPRDGAVADVVRDVVTGLPHRCRVVPIGTWRDLLGEPPVSLPTVTGSSLAQIQFTSGTTGRPKGVRVRHESSVLTAHAFATRLGLPGPSKWVNPMPLFHTAGNVLGTIGALSVAAEQVVLPFEPAAVLRVVAESGADVLSAAPTVIDMLRSHEDFARTDLSRLRVIYTGGSMMSMEFLSSMERDFGVRISVAFGMTETCGAALQTAPLADDEETRWTTVGRPLPGVEARVVDENGADQPPNVPGELLLRGPSITDGYHDDPEATAAAIDREGWLHTGDLAVVDEVGRFRIVGRIKEMIKTGGENVSPAEVEAVLLSSPDVSRAAVVGIPDDRWGELVTAFIVPADPSATSVDLEKLEALCRSQLSRFKIPRRWFVVDELPLTGSTKINRAELRRRAMAASQ